MKQKTIKPYPQDGNISFVWKFFGLAFALAAPFWLLGNRKLPLPVKLPGSALIFVIPVIAAAVLTRRESGPQGVRNLLHRAFDYRKIKNPGWYLPILLLNPLFAFLSYGVMRMACLPLPAELKLQLQAAPFYFALFFVTGLCEELGWQGYAYDRLRQRWGWRTTSLLLGVAWAGFHVIPDLQNGQMAGWIFWQRLGSIANRVIMGWIYEHSGGSVFGSILYHAMNNVSWAMFPNDGSHYNPMITTVITGLIAVILWLSSHPSIKAGLKDG